MTGDEIRVLLVGTGEGFGSDLERDGFEVRRIPISRPSVPAPTRME